MSPTSRQRRWEPNSRPKAYFLASPSCLLTTLPSIRRDNGGLLFSGLKSAPRIQFSKAANVSYTRSRSFNTRISCSAQPETLETVQNTIAKQLSLDVSQVTPDSKFADLGADSLDTVEIMMALEEQFEVSIGEGGAESIATVQQAADLVEKVKVASA